MRASIFPGSAKCSKASVEMMTSTGSVHWEVKIQRSGLGGAAGFFDVMGKDVETNDLRATVLGNFDGITA